MRIQHPIVQPYGQAAKMTDSNDRQKMTGSADNYSHLGLTMAAAITALGYLGNLLDKKLTTDPLFLLVGSGWGLTISIIYLFRVLKKINAKDSEKH
jgi:F0F1-type ATP synthase assembly protein I